MPVDRTWYELRALRARPPGLVADHDLRRAVFNAALRQSEELFDAARVVSLASKPLPLFYALSQAGRAIAAAHLDSDDWQIFGHGLSITGANADIGATLIEPRPRRADAFSVVSQAIGSEPIRSSVSLAQVWASIPELEVLMGLRRGERAVLGIVPHDAMAPASSHLLRSTLHAAHGVVVLPDVDSEDDVRRQLAGYAATEGAIQPIPPGLVNGQATVSLRWPAPTADTPVGIRRLRALHEVALECDGRWYLQPLIGDPGTAPAQLMLWWMLLLALSSAARYQPAAWTAATDLERSSDAVELQEGLAIAERCLPRLVLRHLRCGHVSPGLPLAALIQSGDMNVESRGEPGGP